jgi:hypothetical protein
MVVRSEYPSIIFAKTIFAYTGYVMIGASLADADASKLGVTP